MHVVTSPGFLFRGEQQSLWILSLLQTWGLACLLSLGRHPWFSSRGSHWPGSLFWSPEVWHGQWKVLVLRQYWMQVHLQKLREPQKETEVWGVAANIRWEAWWILFKCSCCFNPLSCLHVIFIAGGKWHLLVKAHLLSSAFRSSC